MQRWRSSDWHPLGGEHDWAWGTRSIRTCTTRSMYDGDIDRLIGRHISIDLCYQPMPHDIFCSHRWAACLRDSQMGSISVKTLLIVDKSLAHPLRCFLLQQKIKIKFTCDTLCARGTIYANQDIPLIVRRRWVMVMLFVVLKWIEKSTSLEMMTLLKNEKSTLVCCRGDVSRRWFFRSDMLIMPIAEEFSWITQESSASLCTSFSQWKKICQKMLWISFVYHMHSCDC